MELMNFRLAEPTQWHKALFDVRVEMGESSYLIVRNIKLCQGKAGGYFITMPSFKSTVDDRYMPYVEFIGQKKKELEKEMLALVVPMFDPLSSSQIPF